MDLLFLLFIILLYFYFREKHKADSEFYGKNKVHDSNNKKNYNSSTNNSNPSYRYHHNKSSVRSSYKMVDSLLTPAESKYFDSLVIALEGSSLYICPKVRLADVIVVDDKKNWGTLFNKIKAKHIDFLLCDKLSMVPKYAIELDDSSHLKKNRIERDEFFNKVLSDAGVYVIRQKISYSYDINEIRKILNVTSSSS